MAPRAGSTPRRHDAVHAVPEFYRILGAPDTVDGRFELLTLHIVLLLERLKEQPAVRQDLFDTYVSDLDGALREMGVGDLSMGRSMKQLGQVFYGRAAAFGAAFKVFARRDRIARTDRADGFSRRLERRPTPA